MWRLVILAIIVWVAFKLVKRVLLQQSSGTNGKEGTAEHSAKDPENMVKCTHCGVHLPVSEAFLANQLFYCSKAHLPNVSQ